LSIEDLALEFLPAEASTFIFGTDLLQEDRREVCGIFKRREPHVDCIGSCYQALYQRNRAGGRSNEDLRVRAETKPEKKVAPRLFWVLELRKLVHPGAVVLRSAELVRLVAVVADGDRAGGERKAPF